MFEFAAKSKRHFDGVGQRISLHFGSVFKCSVSD